MAKEITRKKERERDQDILRIDVFKSKVSARKIVTRTHTQTHSNCPRLRADECGQR